MKFSLLLLLAAATSFAAETKPKYGPEATVISQSHEYFRANPAPDYWAISPYYVAQMDDSACSVASVSAIVNAARVGRKLTSDDELATQKGLLSKVKHTAWNGGVLGKIAYSTKGVTLDQLGVIVGDALKAYGVEGAKVEVMRFEDNAAGLEKLIAVLAENEKSAKDLVILNFNQKLFTGDAEVGHISPLGAYDASKKRALVMDTDRQWYEPYWVSTQTLLKAMATLDKVSGKTRGLVLIKLR